MNTASAFTFTGIEQAPSPPDPDDQVLPCWAESAHYDYGTAWMLITTNEEWEWGQLSVDFDCDGPPHNHWLAYELDALCNLGEVLGVATGNETTQFLLEHGIAPGQPFWIRASYSCTQDYWGEWDSETDWEVTGMAPWSLERVATAWEAFLGRQRILIP